MTDTVFRSRLDESTPEVLPNASTGPHTASQVQIEVPFTDYKLDKGHPFSVDHYDLGQTWDDPDGGFEKEVSVIESYLNKLIERGEIANNQKSVKMRLKEVEKTIGIRGDERTVVRVGMVASYLRFLNETDEIKNTMRKYDRS